MSIKLPRLKVESETFLHLDVLRFSAAMGIVFCHYAYGLVSIPDWLKHNLEGLRFFVDMFFVISGVVIDRVYGDRIRNLADYGAFLWRRVSRLVPLHWATLLFFVALGVAVRRLGVSVDSPERYGWDCLLPHVFMLHSTGVCSTLGFNYVSWSISAEMIAYVALPAMLLLRHYKLLLFSGVGMIVALYAAGPLLPRAWCELNFDGGFLRALPAFALGLWFGRQQERLFTISSETFVCAFFAFVALIVIGAPAVLMPLAAYAVAILGLCADRGKAAPFIRRIAPLSQLTYSTYLLHTVVWTLFIRFVAKGVLHVSGPVIDLWIVLGVVVTIGMSYVSLFAFEQPCRRVLQNLAKRPQRKVAAHADPSGVVP